MAVTRLSHPRTRVGGPLSRPAFSALVVPVVALMTTPSAIGQLRHDQRRTNGPVAFFVQLPAGWHQYREAPDATALNWQYHPSSDGWAPSMQRDAIAVTVYFPHPRGKQSYRPLRLTLPRRPSTLLEGTRDTPEFRIFGRVRGVDVNIFIDIRRLHPTRRQLRVARRVVSNIRFRGWARIRREAHPPLVSGLDAARQRLHRLSGRRSEEPEPLAAAPQGRVSHRRVSFSACWPSPPLGRGLCL